MKTFVLFVMLLSGSFLSAAEKDSLMVVFWNLENFFDYKDSGGGEADSEFSSMGKRRWTKKRFYTKCDAVAKSILWMEDKYGRLPDVIGLAEVENDFVLKRLLYSTALRKVNYRYVHYESGDRRGIDVALLYRGDSLTEIYSRIITPVDSSGRPMRTRDMLHVSLMDGSGEVVDYIVNHHPSKFGGASASEGKRMTVMKRMVEYCDSLVEEGREVVVMGDFNDIPSSAPFVLAEKVLDNKARKLFERGYGTIRYEGKWDLIDMFLVTPVLSSRSMMEICEIPFLMVQDTKFAGEKPFRTWSGPRYIGGVSDHCPIVLFVLSP